MNLLARREHAEAELIRKLRIKKFAEDDIRIVLKQLSEQGLLSQTRFIDNYIHYRSGKGYGPERIRAELLQRGITEDFIEEHLNIADNVWFARARAVWQKRFKGQLPTDYKTRAKQMQFLHYRGFTSEQIENIFSK